METRYELMERALRPEVRVTERERALMRALGLIPVTEHTYRGKVSL